MTEEYDSGPDTQEHISEVRSRIELCVADLSHRSEVHDKSKLEDPEKSTFDRVTPLLRGLTYGSNEYRAMLAEIKPALEHHYANNTHHPEFYPDGIRGMSLLDLVEMLCDWKAATLRHADGDIRKSIEINQSRFKYSDELKQVLLNTLPVIEG